MYSTFKMLPFLIELRELQKFKAWESEVSRSPTPIQLNRQDTKKTYTVTFSDPQRALTPGQVLAIYDGERLVGSGIYAHSSMGRACLSA